MNGEGYCNLQLDDNIRSSVGLTITPEKQSLQAVWRHTENGRIMQPVFVLCRFKKELLTIGAE